MEIFENYRIFRGNSFRKRHFQNFGNFRNFIFLEVWLLLVLTRGRHGETFLIPASSPPEKYFIRRASIRLQISSPHLATPREKSSPLRSTPTQKTFSFPAPRTNVSKTSLWYIIYKESILFSSSQWFSFFLRMQTLWKDMLVHWNKNQRIINRKTVLFPNKRKKGLSPVANS